MKIVYTPIGNMGDKLNKYGYDFKAGDAIDVVCEYTAAKMIQSPFLSEEIKVSEKVAVFPKKKAAKKKANVKK